ncbi:MAG: hypothetical protein RTU63_03545 [Candidatus Thorarchaeota archaeon]
MIVREPKYKPDFEAYKIRKYAIGAAGYLHAFNKGELWFIPISNIPDEDKMQEIIVQYYEIHRFHVFTITCVVLTVVIFEIPVHILLKLAIFGIVIMFNVFRMRYEKKTFILERNIRRILP